MGDMLITSTNLCTLFITDLSVSGICAVKGYKNLAILINFSGIVFPICFNNNFLTSLGLSFMLD